MSSALTPTLELSAKRVLTRTRELPISGRVLVKEGQILHSETAVLSADLPGDLLILKVAERMGLSAEEVIEGLKVSQGSNVQRGDLICEKTAFFGFLRNSYKAPVTGTLEFISSKTGHLGLRLPSTPLNIKAYLEGKVLAIEAGRSVTIGAEVAFLQGIFGVGGEQTGQLHFLDCGLDRALGANEIPDNSKDLILIGGMQASIEALRKAEAVGAKGIITASLDDRALKEFLGYDLGVAITGSESIPLSLIITEGFGAIPMSPRIIDVLKQHHGKQVAINGATQVRAGARRPELIVPLNSDIADNYLESPELKNNSKSSPLAIGSQIRLIRVPYFGQIAEVLELPEQPEVIPTGAKTRVLRARLINGSTVTVPRANVELL